MTLLEIFESIYTWNNEAHDTLSLNCLASMKHLWTSSRTKSHSVHCWTFWIL